MIVKDNFVFKFLARTDTLLQQKNSIAYHAPSLPGGRLTPPIPRDEGAK